MAQYGQGILRSIPRSSHFDAHGHQNDPAFDNVILHVVAENDKKVFNTRGEEILTVRDLL